MQGVVEPHRLYNCLLSDISELPNSTSRKSMTFNWFINKAHKAKISDTQHYFHKTTTEKCLSVCYTLSGRTTILEGLQNPDTHRQKMHSLLSLVSTWHGAIQSHCQTKLYPTLRIPIMLHCEALSFIASVKLFKFSRRSKRKGRKRDFGKRQKLYHYQPYYSRAFTTVCVATTAMAILKFAWLHMCMLWAVDKGHIEFEDAVSELTDSEACQFNCWW